MLIFLCFPSGTCCVRGKMKPHNLIVATFLLYPSLPHSLFRVLTELCSLDSLLSA